MVKKHIHIVGSSIASRFGIDSPSWPELLSQYLDGDLQVSYETQDGMTFTRAIPLISNMESADVLILHFGIAVGWPVSFRKVDIKLGTTPLKNEYAFHQPRGKGHTAKGRLKNRVKFRLRNGLKYLLFLLGQYKPRVNPRDLQDQISAVLSIAHSKTKEVIWIQHVPAWSMRTYVERWYYRRYISRVKWFAETIKPVGTYFIIPSDELARVENYAQDTTHLSAEGHRAYFEYFSQLPVIKKLQRV